MWQKIKNLYHLFIAVLANIWFGFPSRKLTVIGVTGTDGKTTTVSLIYHILKEARCNVSMISSVGAIIDGKTSDIGFHVTTPSSWALQRFFKKAAFTKNVRGPAPAFPPASARSSLNLPSQGSNELRAVGSLSSRVTPRFLVLEVTSHALDQYRVWGIDFAVGALTNVTREHLDYHKTYENYVKTKAKLLQKARVSITNKDDKSYELISSKFKVQSSKLRTYGFGKDSDINLKNFSFKTKLIGDYNKYNILAAASVCRSLGLKNEVIKKAIVSFETPSGRGEVVYKNSFSVMIDFAHTPNAFEKILSALRPSVKGRIIHVFGSAGLRDREKRSEMGRISAKYADVIILTAEDPRSESVDNINNEIISGIQNSESRIQNGTLLRITNRKEAIARAIKMAQKGDFVLITGKAHEKSMNYGHGEEPWSEFEAVKKALKSRKLK